MNLLDELEDVTSFQKPLQSDSEDEASQNGLNIDINAISSTFAGADVSILSRVKQRLQGKFTGDDTQLTNDIDTQPIRDENETQPVSDLTGFSLGASILGFGAGPQVQRLPQLPIDESEYNQTQPIESDTQPVAAVSHGTQVLDASQTQMASTQKIAPYASDATQAINEPDAQPRLASLFEPEEDDEEDGEDSVTKPLTKEERLAKIAELAEQKKLQRLEREKQLEADISHATLTDEENDLNEDNKPAEPFLRKDVVSTKQLAQAEEFLNVQKRHRDIRPQFEKKLAFTKDRLLSAFDSDEDDNESKPEDLDLDNVKSSPTTSPLKASTKPDLDDAEEFDVSKLKPKEVTPFISTTQSRNPIEAYANNLKRLLSSPNGENAENQIDLDDSESDLEILESNSSPLKPKSAAARSNDLKIPELSKHEKFAVKQRFSKKKYGNHKPMAHHGEANIGGQKNFLDILRKANITQLKAHHLSNPNHDIIAEMEKDEEVMGSLLEREMERVRNIRKQEKLRERAKAALLSKHNSQDAIGSDVPESDMESEVPESEEDDEVYDEDEEEEHGSDGEAVQQDGEGDDEEETAFVKPRRAKLVFSEDENEEEQEDISAQKDIEQPLRHDDSYMFGGDRNEDSLLNEDVITTESPDIAPIQIEQDKPEYIGPSKSQSEYKLFQNLQPRSKSSQQLSQESTLQGSVTVRRSLPEFKEASAPNTQTQVDVHTQVDPTQADSDTQQIDDITPLNVEKGREHMKSLLENIREAVSDEEKEEEEESEDPEVIKQRIKEYEDKIRRRELKMRKKRKELERKGIKNIVEGEAEESEDEWHGLGGDDGELSDYQANSEDEKMIDNDFNIDLKNDEVRKKFMEQYQIKDQKELEKLLDDIKNHRLTKKVGGNGFDIELSDEEDEILAAYRRQKISEQQERLAKNKKLHALSKNEKMKAFFASIQENNSVIRLDDDEDEEIEDKETKQVDDPDDEEKELDAEAEGPVKKTIRIEESFVQKQLSFLVCGKDDDADYERIQKLSNRQHGIESDDDVEDLHSLKAKSLSSLSGSRPQSLENDSRKRSIDEANLTDVDEDDEDDEFMPSFKKPSIIQSFKSFHDQQRVQIKDGKQQFSGVTVSKQYRVASGSKASITYMSKNKAATKEVKSLRERRIAKSLNMSKEQGKKLFMSGGFE